MSVVGRVWKDGPYVFVEMGNTEIKFEKSEKGVKKVDVLPTDGRRNSGRRDDFWLPRSLFLQACAIANKTFNEAEKGT